MKPIAMTPWDLTTLPTIHDLIGRAREALMELYLERSAPTPLSPTEYADALIFARTHIENDLAALRQRFIEVKALADQSREFLAQSDLSIVARLYLRNHMRFERELRL